MKRVAIASVCVGIALLGGGFWLGWRLHAAATSNRPATAEAHPTVAISNESDTPTATAPTNVYAHNLMLRTGPSFRVYVRWLRGQMVRANRNEIPSFDDSDSFVLEIEDGVLR